jgi:hypothetical protein
VKITVHLPPELLAAVEKYRLEESARQGRDVGQAEVVERALQRLVAGTDNQRYRARKRAAGRCTLCTRKRVTELYCARHRDDHARQQRQRQREAREQEGRPVRRCSLCGKLRANKRTCKDGHR